MNSKLKLTIFISSWLLLTVAVGYYILANTTLAKNVLLRGEVAGINTSSLEINTFQLDVDGNIYRSNLAQIAYPDWQERLAAYGKGSNPLKVIFEGLQALAGNDILKVIVDEGRLEQIFQQQLSAPVTKIESGNLLNCGSNNYDFQIDQPKLKEVVFKAVKEKSVSTSWDKISTSKELPLVIATCQQAAKPWQQISQTLGPVLGPENLLPVLAYRLTDNNWFIYDTSKANNLLQDYKQRNDKSPFGGSFVVKNNRVLLFQPYQYGKQLQVAESVLKINQWLAQPENALALSWQETIPDAVKLGLPIDDFTYTLGVGRTRIDLIRNGKLNAAADFVVYSLIDLQDVIIQPGQKFSYLNTVNPSKSNYTRSGQPIGNGYCMGTSTLFRAALEAGLPINERHNHGHNIASYSWSDGKYPYNIVDAAYYTSPTLDFKFTNDTAYPLFLRVTGTRETDGYQYNKIEILGSSKLSNRKVELKNWWVSRTNSLRFDGSFERVVTQDGKVIRQDKFESKYR